MLVQIVFLSDSFHVKSFVISFRYIYVNVRKWPNDFQITEPFKPAEIQEEIDMHVIDLVTMRDLGALHRGHRGLTREDCCFLIYIDVCEQYVARYTAVVTMGV